MPIFEYQGKTYDVADQYIDSFAEEFPDAKTMIDQDGNNYSVKSKYYKDFLNEFSVPRPEIQKAMATTYSVAPEPSEGAEEVNPVDPAKGSGRTKISASKPQQNEVPSTPIQAEPIRKFGEGVKQGYTGIIAGSKYGIGEAAEKIVGTRNDDYEALKKIAQLEAEGKDVAEEAQKEYAPVENINPLLSGILKITGGGEAIGEVEKNAQANRTIRKVLEETGGDIEKAKLLLGARAGQSTYADKMRDYAAAKMAQARPTKGWATVGALVPQMAGNVVGLGLSAITKMPVFAQVLGNVNTGVLTASSAGQAMAEARQAGASNAQVWGAGLVNGLVEKVTEDYQLNNRYVKRLVDAVKGRASKQLVDAVSEIGSPANKEMQDLLARANKRLGGKLFSGKNVADYLGDVVSEGSSEFTAEALQTIAPILYENKEDYPTLMQALEAGVEGFKGGVLMGGFMGGISKTAEHRMNRDRRKAQGYVKVAEITDNNNNTEVVEVVRDNENPDQEVFYWNGEKIPILDANVRQVQTFSFDDFERGRIELENDEAYENGRSLESPEEKSDATTALDVATQEFRERFGLGEDGDVDTYLGANPYETARLEYDKDPELGQVALNYIYAKSNVDGIIDSTKDQIEQRISEATSLIDSRINKTDGMIHPAILRENGKPVYIIDGDVKMFDDGSINTQESPESIIIVDAETMKPEFIAPSVLSKADAPIDPNVEKESVRSTITEAIATQTENEMNGVQPFNIGDVYPIIDTDGTERTVQVVANDGNGNVQVLFNGEQEPTQATINDIQQLIDTSRRNRYMIAQEANKAMEDAQIAENIEANDSDAETMPEVTPATVKREMPMQKNGQPDFNAMDPEMFVDEYVNRYGEDSATKLARKNISVAREAIAKIDKKIDDVVDPNQMEALSQQKDAAQAQLDRYIDILGRLGATDNETEAEEKSRLRKDAGNKIAQLFPDGLPNVESFILADIATGNRIRWSDKEVNGAVTSRGLGAELGYTEAERRKRLPLIGKDAMTPEEYAESLRERLDAAGIRYDESSLRDAVLSVYQSIDSRKGAWDALEDISRRGQEPEMDTDWEDMQAQMAYNKAQNVGAPALPDMPDLATIEEETPISGEEEAEIETQARAEEQADYDAMMEENPPVIEENAEDNEEVALTIEKRELQNKIQDWLTPENVSWAEGRELSESIEKFGNTLEPIAILPKILNKYFPNVPLYLYSGKGYLIDHAANHHPELAVEEYNKIQEVIDSYDDIKDLSTPNTKKIAFVKMLDKGFAVVTELAEKDGKIMLHKTFFYKDSQGKRVPYKNKPSLLRKSPVDGSTTISPTEETVAGRHRNISALGVSESKDTTSEPKSQEVDKKNLQKNVVEKKVNTPTKQTYAKVKKLLIEPTKPDYTTVVAPSMVTMEVPMNVYKYVSKDKLNMYSGVYFDKDKYLVATDLFNLVALKVRDMQRSDADKFVTKQLEKKAEGTFNWRDILVPVDKSIDGVIDFVDIVGKVGKKAKKNEKPKAVRIAYNGESILIPAERLQPLADFQKAVGIGDIRFANIGKDNNIPKIQINTGANVALAVGLDPKVAPYWSVYEYEVGGELTPPTSEKQESAPVEDITPKSEVLSVIRGDKWNATDEPTKMKFNRKGDNFDGYITVGKKKYGRTTSEGEEFDILLEDYGTLENAWNAYEQNEVFISPNLASIVKAILVDRYGDVKDTAEVDDGQQILFRNVYHGSGAEFDKFDHSFIGTGEGNQAFGWGTYVTEVEGIGKQYARMTSKPRLSFKGDFVNTEGFYNPWRIVSDLFNDHHGKLRDMRAAAERYSSLVEEDNPKLKALWEDVKQVLSIVRSGDLKTSPARYLYSVEIPDNDGTNYLEYGKSLSKAQLNNIKRALYNHLAASTYKGAEQELKQELDEVFAIEQDGKDIYGTIGSYLGSDKATSEFLNKNGYVGISYPADGGNAGNARNYVIFNEADLNITDSVRFRSAEPAPVFYSNAEYAVKAVKQEKATPEQWLKMIEKNGGLKAGEDKWLGLSDWLKASDKKTLTKQEVLDFIKENQIQIGEVEYVENPHGFEELKREYDGWLRDEGYDYAWDRLIDRYGDDAEIAFTDFGGELQIENAEAAATLLGGERSINPTRLGYTTEGLENNKEIALVVPAIESWNESDDIHFGDAGEGRAVAWIRFGETTAESKESIAASEAVENYLAEMREKYGTPVGEETDAMSKSEISHLQRLTARELNSKEYGERVLVIDEVQSKRHQEGREKGYNNPRVIEILNRLGTIESYMYSSQGLSGKMYSEREALKTELESLFEAENPAMKAVAEQIGQKSVRLAELQQEKSSREDDEKVEIIKIRNKQNEVRNVRDYDYYESEIDEIEKRIENRDSEIDSLKSEINKLNNEYSRYYNTELRNARIGVSPAPFEKNWAELAMKRMLRYAAENGFDKIAWTTGEQQADRYDLSKSVDVINAEHNEDGSYNINIATEDDSHFIQENNIPESRLAELVGKEIALSIVKVTQEREDGKAEIEGDNLRIGGEGMKAFYDQMLPSFMNKYGKKWGVKVQDVTLPHLAKPSSVMHSIDVTDAMRESVMQGQPMFRIINDYKELFSDLQSEYDALDKNDAEALNEWRDKKLNVIKSYLDYVIQDFNYPVKEYFIVANKQDMRTLFDRCVDASIIEDDVTFDEFEKEINRAEAIYVEDLDIIVATVYGLPNNEDSIFSTLFHEQTHKVINSVATKQQLSDIWDEAVKNNEPKVSRIIERYGEDPVRNGAEYVAYTIERFSYPKRRDNLESYIKNEGTVTLDYFTNNAKKTLPLRNALLENILKFYNDEYRNRKEENTDGELLGRRDKGVGSIEATQSRTGHGQQGADRRGRVLESATSLASSLGVKLNIIEDVTEIVDSNKEFQRKKRGAKAWYDVATDQVYFVVPNATSIADAQQSVLHEVVAHKGLRDVIGRENFNKFLDKVFHNAAPEIRAQIVRLASQNGWNFRVATEEYLASLAEKGFDSRENRTFWQKVRDFFMDMLREAKIVVGYNITDNDMRYMLWRTYQMQKSKGAMAVAENVAMQQKLGVGNFRTRPAGTRQMTEEDVVFNPNQIKSATDNVGTFDSNNPDVRFRAAPKSADIEDGEVKQIRKKYDKKVNTGRKGTLKATKYNFIEAFQDEMRSLKEYQALLEKAYGKKIPPHLDVYALENRIGSAGFEKFRQFEDGIYEDMMRFIDDYISEGGETLESVITYARTKSGLERNREFTVRDYIDTLAKATLISKQEAKQRLEQVNEDLKNDLITPTEADARRHQINNLLNAKKHSEEEIKAMREQYKAQRDAYRNLLENGMVSFEEFNKMSDAYAKKFTGQDIADYSGLSATAEKMGKDPDEWSNVAMDIVKSFEQKHDNTIAFWGSINACNNAVLREVYNSGMLNGHLYDYLQQQFLWYIPMSGFNEDTAEDVYSYIGGETGAFTPPVKRAGGRESESDDPFAIIGNKMQGAILQGNRNRLKLSFMNLTRTYPTDLVTEGKVWLVKQPDGTWVMNSLEIPEGISSEEAARLIEEYDKEMRDLKKQGMAMEHKNKLNLPYAIKVKSHKNDHEIIAYRNGQPYVMYVNGNPQLAKAINGKLKDKNINLFYKKLDEINRLMSANKTSWNPDFIPANVNRDFQQAILMTFIDAGVKDAAKVAALYVKVFPEVVRSISGSSNKDGKYSAYFEEFLQNGGETGYSHLRDVDEWKKVNQRRWARLNNAEKIGASGVEAFNKVGAAFSYVNRIAEDSTRFTIYVYNRQKGKTIAESIKAAKDISTNFNKKGSGATEGVWGSVANFLRRWFLFFNPMVQGVYQHWGKMNNSKKRYALVFASMAGLGYLMAVLNHGWSDDDDEEMKYFNQNDYTRRNNLMIYTGNGYVKIPLAPIFREMYALGDIMYSVQRGVITPMEGTMEVVNLVRGIFKLEGQSSLKDNDYSWLRLVLPESSEVIADVEDNVTFTGAPLYKDTPWNKNDPEYQKVYKGTWQPLIELSKAVNDMLPQDEQLSEVDDQMAGKGSNKWINPAVWQHIIEEVLGGVGKTAGDVYTIGESLINDKDLNMYNIPVAKRFYSKPDERVRGRILKNRYFDAMKSLDRMDNKLKKAQHFYDDSGMSLMEKAENIAEYWDSEVGKRHKLLKDSDSRMNKLTRREKVAKNDAEREQIALLKEQEMTNLIQALKSLESSNK